MSAPFAAVSERVIVQLLQAIAANKKIACTLHAEGWIIQLTHRDVHRFVYGYTFDLNSGSATYIADDKAGMSSLLAANQIPHIPHQLVLSPTVLTDAPDACADILNEQLHTTAALFGYPLVCKVNQGSGGKLVFRVADAAALDRAAAQIFRASRALSLSPYVEIYHEYRVIMLQGTALLAYEKIRPAKRHASPEKHWRHNLGQGATPRLLPLEQTVALAPLAARAMQAANLQVAAVDLVVDAEAGVHVLEVNAGIMMEHFARLHPDGEAHATAVYEQIIEAMFIES